MRKKFPALVMLFMLAMPVPGHAGGSLEDFLSGEELLSTGFYRTVVVASIHSVDGTTRNTNGDPPRLRIEVLEVLKGSIKTGAVSATWKPFPHDVDWVGAGSTERISAWASRPNTPPEVGSTWILSSRQAAAVDHLDIAPRARWRFTEVRRNSVIAILHEAAATTPGEPADQTPQTLEPAGN